MSSEDFESIKTSDINISVKKWTINRLIIGLIIITGIAMFFTGSYALNSDSDKISQEELKDVISKLELKILQNQLPTTQPTSPVKISADNDPIIGNPDAKISIIEFSDFQCPFCVRFHIQTLPLILEKYIDQGKMNLVFRDFPI